MLDGSRIYRDEERSVVLQEIVAKHRQTKSGVIIDINTFEDALFLKPPISSEKPEFVFLGSGITDRKLPEYEFSLTGITDALLSAQGKIAFFGNGLSNVPLETVVKRYENGLLDQPPTIVDLFDYQELSEDLHGFAEELSRNNLSLMTFNGNTIDYTLETLDEISRAVSTGSLKTIKYCIGTGNPPDEIKGLALAVSYCGTPDRSINEQLSLLAPNGTLFTTIYYRPNRFGFTYEPLSQGTRITKKNSPFRQH